MIRGGAGDNWLFGGDGSDQIIGGAECDWIEGGAGADTITGGGYHGHVLYWSSKAGVTVNLTTGATSGGDAQGHKLSGIEAVDGSNFGDTLTGNNGDNWTIGLGGNDALRGMGGNDRIDGGAGADRFDFDLSTDSTKGVRDSILDFMRGQDKIDLSTIDASTRAVGNQAFAFIGASAFYRKAGELHTVKTSGGLYIEGDVNGDARADFQIYVKAIALMSAAEFVL
jgi:serralysin